MARVEDNQAFATRSAYSPVREEGQQQEGKYAIEMEDEVASSSWCCCFGFPSFGGGKKINQESRSLLQEEDNNNIDHGDYLHTESWFVNQLKQLKEFSELVAGPRWKNFIRKIGRYSKPKKYTKTAQTMYSPNSYALNFDDTRLEDDEEDDYRFSFSSRFSAPLSSTDKGRPATTNSL